MRPLPGRAGTLATPTLQLHVPPAGHAQSTELSETGVAGAESGRKVCSTGLGQCAHLQIRSCEIQLSGLVSQAALQALLRSLRSAGGSTRGVPLLAEPRFPLLIQA